MRPSKFLMLFSLVTLALFPALAGSEAQMAWFADGYHGGVYGHYPTNFTQYFVEELRKHPDWKLNLEIEPETWDSVRTNTPEAYRALKELVSARGSNRRVEFVNPAYGQSYLWNISGESGILQFERGLEKLREHFPEAEINTYCSEEPCFTSALPGMLKSFGFKYAVLKNPNTCWGGYTRAHGGELVTWVGPDGTGIPTVPRYQIEALKPGSVWETIAAYNRPEYIRAALEFGIAHPVGMCLQDAGWRYGPWLEHSPGAYAPNRYTTWSEYFQMLVKEAPAPEWRVSQEDIQVSLVWGAQVVQRIAQEVRAAENQLVMAEKLAVLANVRGHFPWPKSSLDEAWRTLLLSQHHDCWIVPSNGRGGNTWADKVSRWTDGTCQTSGEIIGRATESMIPSTTATKRYLVRVFNTLGQARTSVVSAVLPGEWPTDMASVYDGRGRPVVSQLVTTDGRKEVVFTASVPALGYETFWLKQTASESSVGNSVVRMPSGIIRVETDLYRLEVDPARGGTVCSLVAKRLGGREFVDASNARRFNEIRGYFFKDQRYYSTADRPARVEIVETGPARVRLLVSNTIASHPVSQWITLVRGEPRIDLKVKIDWQGNPGIGADHRQSGGFRWDEDRKAFYDDRLKLLALFPLNLADERVFKDAPFDVTASQLNNTFFENWSELKNNVILRWVDVCSAKDGAGLALLGDHTTSYAHGADHPLGLTLQYCGVGLWGRNYSVQGPTEIQYALLPHAGDWQKGSVWAAGTAWNEPLVARVYAGGEDGSPSTVSLLEFGGADWEIPTMRLDAGRVLVRLFNPSSDGKSKTVHYGARTSKVEVVQLNGQVQKELPLRRNATGGTDFDLALPSMAVGTLRITR